MKNTHILLLLLMSFVLTDCADTSTADGTIIPPSTLQPLANWVEQQTNVKMAALPITEASGMRLKTALGLTVLIAEQSCHQATAIADRAYMIAHGEIVMHGDEISAAGSGDAVREIYLGV